MMAAPCTNDDEAVERLEHEVTECMSARVLPRDNPGKVAVAIWSLVRGFLARRPDSEARQRYRAVIGLMLPRFAAEPLAQAA